MLTQADVVNLLAKEPPPAQVVAFSILHAGSPPRATLHVINPPPLSPASSSLDYVYSKSSRGNLPSETLSKLLSVQRKLLLKQNGRCAPTTVRAFDAMKAQLVAVNRKWFSHGAQAFGPLGAIGATGGNADAKLAWTKATDGKVKVFPDGDGGGAMGWMPGEMDAGRVIDPTTYDTADPLASLPRGGAAAVPPPPMYDGPPPDQVVVDALNERREQDAAGTTVAGRDSIDVDDEGRRSTSPLGRSSIDEGAAHLARLRQLKEEKERRESASPSPIPEEPAKS